MFKKLLNPKAWALFLLMLFAIPIVADDFNSQRTDFRDESIYFMMTTRFYDGDTGNNVLCWDNQEEQIKPKDPCWRGDFQGVMILEIPFKDREFIYGRRYEQAE